MTPKHFDSQNAKLLVEEINEALKAVGDKWGISLKVGRRYSWWEKTMRIPLEAAIQGDDGVLCTEEVQQFRLRCFGFGLSPDDLGRKFNYDGDHWKIKGLNPRSRRYPIIAENSAGKRMRFSLSIVKPNLLPIN